MGKRTTVPSRLMSSAVGFVQINVAECPASNNFVPNNEPYEAPRINTLYCTVSDRSLLARSLDFLVIETGNGLEDLFGMLAEKR